MTKKIPNVYFFVGVTFITPGFLKWVFSKHIAIWALCYKTLYVRP